LTFVLSICYNTQQAEICSIKLPINLRKPTSPDSSRLRRENSSPATPGRGSGPDGLPITTPEVRIFTKYLGHDLDRPHQAHLLAMFC
jgi:hypothetical protein